MELKLWNPSFSFPFPLLMSLFFSFPPFSLLDRKKKFRKKIVAGCGRVFFPFFFLLLLVFFPSFFPDGKAYTDETFLISRPGFPFPFYPFPPISLFPFFFVVERERETRASFFLLPVTVFPLSVMGGKGGRGKVFPLKLPLPFL